ncbi:fatty acyl-AMP ligase [Mycobacterium hubeiense]|uniref:fatty acyl-AMP ligase n=1 Tax=Mycobacterium hubeiense TaxID=1867256 RepID=UPI000C7F51DD|nr:fatty acyl-AMP ligase [Mycobacterium sp. QGD 101]
MHLGRQDSVGHNGLLHIEECLDADGRVVLPPETTLISLIDRAIANVGDCLAYRYLDHTGSGAAHAVELTWAQLGVRLRAIAAHLQRLTIRGERVAILAPQGLDYVIAYFSAIKAGNIAVPLFAPELPGHTERLETALRDSQPSVVLTTTPAREVVRAALEALSLDPSPHIVAVDEVPDAEGEAFIPVELDVDDVSHLQYTSGATRPPVGVEITHRAAGTNLVQMILSIDLLDRKTRGVSWLPLYHDMGLSMIGFPTIYGGHVTLMSPTAFIRRPQRWIRAMSEEARHGRVVTAAPNFAYEWTAQRGLPAPDEDVDLSDVVMIIGSEPVSIDAITTFSEAFAPYKLPATAIKPSYGIAEATLMVATTDPADAPTVVHLDREQLGAGHAVRVADSPNAVTQVSSGRIARSQWAVIVDPATESEVGDAEVGEIWLHGNNIGRGYWRRPDETQRTFGAKLQSRLAENSHAEGVPIAGTWLRTGDLGVYLDGQLYVVGRMADVVSIDGRSHYPQDIEATAAAASPMVRKGYVAAFSVGQDGDERLVIAAERAAGTSRIDPAPALDAIRSAVAQRHRVTVSDVRLVPAGAIPRTTSGKLARWACRKQYLSGRLGQH